MGIYSWSQQKILFSHLNYTTKKYYFLTNKFENILHLASFNNILNTFEKQKLHKKQITIRIYLILPFTKQIRPLPKRIVYLILINFSFNDTLSLVLSITRTLIHSLTRNSFTRISRAQHLYILTKVWRATSGRLLFLVSVYS